MKENKAKEKAKEIFEKYLNELPKYLQGRLGRLSAKQCALIHLEELENTLFEYYGQDKELMSFLFEVKEEINKL